MEIEGKRIHVYCKECPLWSHSTASCKSGKHIPKNGYEADKLRNASGVGSICPKSRWYLRALERIARDSIGSPLFKG